ncbi:MAG: proton extrusion protein PcxA [Moorea sp. SIO3I7]|nr:proton extrusion protein PcxA [Moorena sp. SIO3I7]
MNLQTILRTARQWFFNTPERALDQAYKAALKIKAIEDEYFGGKKISADTSQYSNSVIAYFEAQINKYIKTINVRLVEFKTSRSVIINYELTGSNPIETSQQQARQNYRLSESIDLSDQQSILIEKLNFIDEIINKYAAPKPEKSTAALIPIDQKPDNQITNSSPRQVINQNSNLREAPYWESDNNSSVNNQGANSKKVTDKTGVLPRSIVGTVKRIQQELDPRAEDKVVKTFRRSQRKTVISIKFILILTIVPILTHQISKTFLVSPIVDHFRSNHESAIFLNYEMEEEALIELKKFEEELHFKSLLGFTPKLSEEEMEEEIKHKANELAEDYYNQGSNAIKNIFADIIALVAFALVIMNSKRDVIILKSFMDDIIYGLSDSAKAFIIILFTDMFVGFHSPHGWEVILEAVSRHLGIPESREFIFLFIATFPVILDSVIKYWIFRYLNRISPSAVATYRTMNE